MGFCNQADKLKHLKVQSVMMLFWGLIQDNVFYILEYAKDYK